MNCSELSIVVFIDKSLSFDVVPSEKKEMNPFNQCLIELCHGVLYLA